MNSDTSKNVSTKIWVIGAGISFILLIVLALAAHTLTTDGTEKFHGIQKKVALEALSFARGVTGPEIPQSKPHINKVTVAPQGTTQMCNAQMTGIEEDYLIEISQRLSGLSLETYTIRICRV